MVVIMWNTLKKSEKSKQHKNDEGMKINFVLGKNGAHKPILLVV